MNPQDAEEHAILEGDVVRVESPRGAIVVRARVGQVRRGAVFAPFHYGTFDRTAIEPERNPRQANELTMTVWDPASKQPYFKTAACRITKVADGTGPAPAPTAAASAPVEPERLHADGLAEVRSGPVGLLREAHRERSRGRSEVVAIHDQLGATTAVITKSLATPARAPWPAQSRPSPRRPVALRSSTLNRLTQSRS
jgi:Molydopterin dinucleotide binding domain